jgi:hypothetical protein
MLQRIYGTAWESEDQLKAYIHFKEEAKRRDHRRLGQDLDLFSIEVWILLLNFLTRPIIALAFPSSYYPTTPVFKVRTVLVQMLEWRVVPWDTNIDLAPNRLHVCN